MKKSRLAAFAVVPALALVAAGAFGFARANSAHANAACTATGFFRDGINMTAAVINPAGTYRGTQGALDATGCNIGIYYGAGHSGTVQGVDISGANYFGVVNDGGAVTVAHNNIHDIGETPLNGTQHGVGIYFTFNSGATGSIVGNSISKYQKGGIVVNGTSDSATIQHNTVIGEEPVNYIAQNGIQVGFGATGLVEGNVVYGNAYSGTNDAYSAGILVVGGPWYGSDYTNHTTIMGNTLIGNDLGVALSNADANGFPPATATDAHVNNNFIEDDAITNISGFGTEGYQAGISDEGNSDRMTNNTVCGAGYVPDASATAFTLFIDDTFTNNPIEHGNVLSPDCGGTSIAHAADTAGASHAANARAKHTNAIKADAVK